MSINYTELKAVQGKIEGLMILKCKLRMKMENDSLTRLEKLELEGIVERLDKLERDERFWKDQVNFENEPERRSKSFEGADFSYILAATAVDCRFRLWESFISDLDENVVPQSGVKEAFLNTTRAFSMKSHWGRRIVINFFLGKVVLLPEFNNALTIFPEIELSVVTAGPKFRELHGKMDYVVGLPARYGIHDISMPKGMALVVREASNTDMECEDLNICIAHAAAVYKHRQDVGERKTCVFGVVSLGSQWKFIKIDEAGVLWQSETLFLDLEEYDEEQTWRIYRSLHQVFKGCYEANLKNTAE